MQAAISGETSIWPRISPTGDSVTYFKLDLGRTETVGVDYRKAVFPPQVHAKQNMTFLISGSFSGTLLLAPCHPSHQECDNRTPTHKRDQFSSNVGSSRPLHRGHYNHRVVGFNPFPKGTQASLS